MNFEIKRIGSGYLEMTVDATSTDVIEGKEVMRLAQQMISAAEDLLYMAGLKRLSDDCGTIVSDLTDYL